MKTLCFHLGGERRGSNIVGSFLDAPRTTDALAKTSLNLDLDIDFARGAGGGAWRFCQ